MTLALQQLKPYKSVVVGEIRGSIALRPLVGQILDEIGDMLLHSRGQASRELITRSNLTRSGDLTVGFFHYHEQRPASWANDPTVLDDLQQLVLVAGRKPYVAILATDAGVKRAVANRLGRGAAEGLGALLPIAPGVLNAAFAQGDARTLWLTGIHRHSSVKADNKVLTGPNLRDALDPIDDQTFYFTAARCVTPLGESEAPVGVAPRRSGIWAGSSRDWQDCREVLSLLFDCLAEVRSPQEDPFPVLAVSTVKINDLDGPYDMSLQPPEAMAETAGEDRARLEAAERLAYATQFLVEPTKGANVKADAWQDRKHLGWVEIALNLDRPDRITWTVGGAAASPAVEDAHRDLLEACREREWLKVHYDSGHTLSAGALFRQKFRDLPFPNFDWVDFRNFEVGREKPDPLTAIGTQRSLFCWVQRFWPNLDGTGNLPGGWLACDDGSMEIADFIHLDPGGENQDPVLTLIHVKGALLKEAGDPAKRASTPRPARRVSVSSYEVVTAQAIKNLRYLDRLHLEGGLEAGLDKQVGKLVWYNRQPSTRNAMLEALKRVRHQYNRKIVVVQPHLALGTYRETQGKEDSDAARLRQLETLLLATRATCANLGADFRVVVDRAGG